jgi:hypothetical protein
MGIAVVVAGAVMLGGAVGVNVDGSAVGVGLACDVQDASKQINKSRTVFFIRLGFPNRVLNDMARVWLPFQR